MSEKPTRPFGVEIPGGVGDTISALDVASMFCHGCVQDASVDVATVMLVAPGGALHLVATSDETPGTLELMKCQMTERPAIDRYENRPVVNYILRLSDEHCPKFAARAIELGFTSAHYLPMRFQQRAIGVLTLLASDSQNLDDHDLALLQDMAAMATIGIVLAQVAFEARRLSAQLGDALLSRVLIEQAKGIVSRLTHGSIDEAFRQIRLYARNGNLGLTNVASAIVTGSLEASSVLDDNRRRTAGG